MLRYTGYQRLNVGINAITRAFNNRLTFGMTLNMANSDETLTARDIGATTTFSCGNISPNDSVFQKDGITYAGRWVPNIQTGTTPCIHCPLEQRQPVKYFREHICGNTACKTCFLKLLLDRRCKI